MTNEKPRVSRPLGLNFQGFHTVQEQQAPERVRVCIKCTAKGLSGCRC
ncbi:hypothetical protein [Lentzea sp. NBRC 105346]|nr:hypothetical protein [Lentzea sp. NBRC 105346]